MLTLFTDVDHTLIYSHRSKPNVECIMVETLNGKAQSFITVKTLETLLRLVERGKLTIVPVTTRTKEQYERLHRLTERLQIQHAMVCNGAVLLDHGQIDLQWITDSRALSKDEMDELYGAYAILKEICGIERTYFPYEVIAYGVCDNASFAADLLKTKVNQKKCYIGQDRRKVYCIPQSLIKGKAVRRFQKTFFIEKSIAAGDSEFDISMFYATEYAVFPAGLCDAEMLKNAVTAKKQQLLSDVICDELIRLTDLDKKKRGWG